jgi:hypothetical protein
MMDPVTRLILIIGFSGESTVTKAGFADVALTLDRQLVWGPPPSETERTAFFAAPASQKQGPHWHDYLPEWRLERVGAKGLALIECFAKSESVALWINPEPNAQLSLIWLLDYLRAHKDIAARLTLVQSDSPIGSRSAEELAKSTPPAVKLTDKHLDLASTVWKAYCAPPPEPWLHLLNGDLSILPQLRQTVTEMLEELPSSTTGLGATETRMLELISKGHSTPSRVFSDQRCSRVFDYWEIGQVLDGLARCPAPAVSGLSDGLFMEVYRNRERLTRYEQSKLALTPLGDALLARTEDFTRHNPINRWWGGTKLTNKYLWRWDPDNKTLIAP